MWKRISAVIGVLLIVGSPANAAFRVILCDTPRQIEQSFTLHPDGTIFEEAIEAANVQAGRPNACSKGPVEATLVAGVRDITLPGNTYTIVRVVVTAVCDGEYMLPVHGIHEQGVAYYNRTDAGAGAKIKPLADFKQAVLRPDQTTSYVTVIVDVGDARKGRAYAENFCSACHNVLGTDATSPNKQAPPFRSIANTPGMSVTALTVWSRTSHPTMPNFVIAPEDMDDLIAYILSLRDVR